MRLTASPARIITAIMVVPLICWFFRMFLTMPFIDRLERGRPHQRQEEEAHLNFPLPLHHPAPDRTILQLRFQEIQARRQPGEFQFTNRLAQ